MGSVVHTGREVGEWAGWDYGKVEGETIFRRNCKGMCTFKLVDDGKLILRLQECRNIRNFSSSGAIISALQSEVIARLTATQGGMSILTTWTYGNLLQFFGKKFNYQRYRKALKNQQKCSIPWHGMHLCQP